MVAILSLQNRANCSIGNFGIPIDNILKLYAMSRFVSPPKDQHNKLRQPLTKGESLVFDFFDSYLSTDWEIYVQPHLNGLRPDFVLLHPRAGIAVFEVKDWDLDAIVYQIKERIGKPPLLIGIRDNKSFSLQGQNPIEKIYRYKKEIHDLYCPRLQSKSGFAVITAGVIFPFVSDKTIKDFLAPCVRYRGMDVYEQYNPLSGMDTIQSGDIKKAFPESTRSSSSYMTPDLAKYLKNWLVEPDFASTQRLQLELSDGQKQLVLTRTSSGYRRIKGPAGSGKSMVLAARAAQLLSEGKEVLVITFNITLLHYLMDIAVRWPRSAGDTRKDITWLNFHLWCKRVCQETDHEEEYRALWRDHFQSFGDNAIDEEFNDLENGRILSDKLPKLIESIIDSDSEGIVKKYDAVLVDEGQDFVPTWWNVLRKVCKTNGEMLLVADATQDIYGTARSWTDEAMKGAGFPGGKWAELELSYRLPSQAIYYAREFAKKFLPKDMIDLPKDVVEQPTQMHLDLFPCKLRWVQTDKEHSVDVCMQEILNIAPSADPKLLAIPDITFLTGSQKFGRKVVGKIGGKGIRSVHTFGKDSSESRRLKMGFYMGDARVKATTLHSFKGWESRVLILYIGHAMNQRAMALVYTGLTRLKRHTEGSFLTVVSSANELAEYGKLWPDYEEKYQ